MTHLVFQSLESRHKYYSIPSDGKEHEIKYVTRKTIISRIVNWIKSNDTVDVNLISKNGNATFTLPYKHGDIIIVNNDAYTIENCFDTITNNFINEVIRLLNSA